MRLNTLQRFERDGIYWIASTRAGMLPLPSPDVEPPPSQPGGVSFGDGTHRIGADIPAGRYRTTTLGEFCSWRRLSGFSGEFEDIIAIELPQGVSALVDISPSDAGFQSDGCGAWTDDLSPVTQSPTAPFGDGDYLVGVDIASGTWRAPGGEFCAWQRLSGFGSEFADIVAIDLPSGAAVVSMAASDTGFRTRGCGTWSRT